MQVIKAGMYAAQRSVRQAETLLCDFNQEGFPAETIFRNCSYDDDDGREKEKETFSALKGGKKMKKADRVLNCFFNCMQSARFKYSLFALLVKNCSFKRFFLFIGNYL